MTPKGRLCAALYPMVMSEGRHATLWSSFIEPEVWELGSYPTPSAVRHRRVRGGLLRRPRAGRDAADALPHGGEAPGDGPVRVFPAPDDALGGRAALARQKTRIRAQPTGLTLRF